MDDNDAASERFQRAKHSRKNRYCPREFFIYQKPLVKTWTVKALRLRAYKKMKNVIG